MTEINTKYGTITEEWQSFGYGRVYCENDVISYRDTIVWKSWKTVRGFERWVDSQAKYSPEAWGEIEPVRGHINEQMEYEFEN